MSVIAKDNHVLKFSPSRFKDEKIPKFLPAGINETPAFNGFCKEHDNIFKQIDDHEIENLFGVYLQIYRTITSEIHSLGIGSVLYPDLDIDTAIAKIAADTRCELEEKNEIIDEEKFQIALTKIKETLVKTNIEKNKKLESSHKTIEVTQGYFLSEIISNKTKLTNTSLTKNTLQVFDLEVIKSQLFIYITDFQIPVAISTMHTCPGIYIDQPNTNHFFIVIPYVNGNIIIGLINNLIPQKMLWKITNKVNNSFKNEISILNFVETLVISSPEGTYFSPDVIESMEDTKRKAFTEDCMFLHEFLSSEKYFSDYDLSIFDHVRSNLFTKLSIESQDVIAKIYSIPARKSYEERLYEMKDKIDKENIILQTLN